MIFPMYPDGTPVPCPICGRQYCDHSLAQRGDGVKEAADEVSCDACQDRGWTQTYATGQPPRPKVPCPVCRSSGPLAEDFGALSAGSPPKLHPENFSPSGGHEQCTHDNGNGWRCRLVTSRTAPLSSVPLCKIHGGTLRPLLKNQSPRLQKGRCTHEDSNGRCHTMTVMTKDYLWCCEAHGGLPAPDFLATRKEWRAETRKMLRSGGTAEEPVLVTTGVTSETGGATLYWRLSSRNGVVVVFQHQGADVTAYITSAWGAASQASFSCDRLEEVLAKFHALLSEEVPS